ncbi:hypothetical protein [Cupriavidus sp. SK-3]|uniref:hypothetical protein n=1 Tax=Cupriavidus sp. SK-3 TaxID=1470558 RepID=UPI0013620099|nr:hypothetical protein [Cupriavidus sp. SK-3]
MRDESSGCVDDGLVAVISGCGEDRGNDRLREGELLLFECLRVEVAFGIEREDGKRCSNDAHRFSRHEFNHHIGRAHALPSKRD